MINNRHRYQVTCGTTPQSNLGGRGEPQVAQVRGRTDHPIWGGPKALPVRRTDREDNLGCSQLQSFNDLG